MKKEDNHEIAGLLVDEVCFKLEDAISLQIYVEVQRKTRIMNADSYSARMQAGMPMDIERAIRNSMDRDE
jgi:hypothetical protein